VGGVDLPPELLWHYTSLEALGAMLATEPPSLMATSVYHLSDTSEVEVAADVLVRVLDAEASREGVSIEQAEQLEGVKRAVRRSRTEEVGDIDYDGIAGVFCLSEDGDLLSQWRSYCPADGGVAIGFVSENLVSRQKGAQKAELVRCAYRQDDAEGVLRNDRSVYNRTLVEAVWREITDGGPFMAGLLGHFYRIATRIKDGAFAEEKEWRLVTPVVFPGDMEVRFHRGRAVPYYPISFDCDWGPDLVRRVVVGPGRLSDLTFRALLPWLKRREIGVAQSAIPFRPL
jgi:hypothetical protein